jgi:hypothetical protein
MASSLQSSYQLLTIIAVSIVIIVAITIAIELVLKLNIVLIANRKRRIQ